MCERERERQTDRQTGLVEQHTRLVAWQERHRMTEERQRDRQRIRDRETENERQTDRQTKN